MKKQFLMVLLVVVFALSMSTAVLADGDVASIDETPYGTLEAAIEAAEEGQTVTLLQDVTVTAPVVIGENKAITLDLGGKSLSCTENTVIANKGTLVVKNGTVHMTGSKAYVNEEAVENYGVLTLESDLDIVSDTGNAVTNFKGTLTTAADMTAEFNGQTSTQRGSGIFIIDGDVTVTGGNIKCMMYALTTNAGESNAELTATVTGGTMEAYRTAIYWPTGTLTLGTEGSSDGPAVKILEDNIKNATGLGTPLEVAGGTVNIYGGTYQAVSTTEYDDQGWMTASGACNLGDAITVFTRRSESYGALTINISNGSFESQNQYAIRCLDISAIAEDNVPVDINITGGIFTSPKASIHMAQNENAAVQTEVSKPTVTGGTFTAGGTADDSVKAYIPEGMALTQDKDGTIITDKGAAVAEVNGIAYTSLQAAVDAVAENTPTTITLLDNVTGSGVKVPGDKSKYTKNITFDLGGHTYTVNSGVGSTGTETSGFQLLKDNKVTFKNGAIAAAPTEGQRIYILIQNYSNLTLENVTLDGTGLQNYSGFNYTLSNNNGEIALNSGAKVIARADGEIAMDVCWAASYENGARVTVNEGAQIEGDVELGLWGQSAYEDGQSVLTVNGGTITGVLKLDSTIAADKIDETIESMKHNVTINSGSFGSDVDAYIDVTDKATAKVESDEIHNYYTSLEAAQKDAQPGDRIVDLTADEEDLFTITLKYNDGVTADLIYHVGKGTSIPLPTLTRDDYTFLGWSDGTKTYQGGSNYTVSGDVTLTAVFEAIATPMPFTDVEDHQWFYEAVEYVYANELMNGVTTTTFEPDNTLTRGMIATILWRADGSEEATETGAFTDVAADTWYADAIDWAAENGIVKGYGDGTYLPDQDVTREQLAAIFHRYADYKGVDVTAEGDLTRFPDADEVSEWAVADMTWAVGAGLFIGREEDNTLDPQGTTTRAEAATLLMRYLEDIAQ